MEKKIAIADLRLGMFIAKLGSSWLKHPFFRNHFVLENPEDLEALRQSGVTEIWIDTARGLDVAPRQAATPAQPPAPAARPAVAISPSAPNQLRSFNQEVERARAIKARARQIVFSLFEEARMGKALELADAVSVVDEINESIERNHSALISLVRLKTKDDYTYLHSVAVCALMTALGKELGLNPALRKELGLAGLLHDIGKIAIPEAILNKPGRLTDSEFDVIRLHPERGAALLRKAPGISPMAIDVCAHHHERVDGKGYPDHLSGEAISLYARMGAICDVYDAITSTRCYKESWTPQDAIRKMASWKDGHFDEKLFAAFVKMIGIYPASTLVRLKSGRLGVTFGHNPDTVLKPWVRVFYSTQTMSLLPVQDIDLSHSSDAIQEVEDPKKWSFDVSAIIGL